MPVRANRLVPKDKNFFIGEPDCAVHSGRMSRGRDVAVAVAVALTVAVAAAETVAVAVNFIGFGATIHKHQNI